MKTFHTWRFKGVNFLATPNRAGDGWHIADENGGNYGAWPTVVRFRKIQATGGETAGPLDACHAIAVIRAVDAETFRAMSCAPCMETPAVEQTTGAAA